MCDNWNLSLTLNDLKIAIPVNTNLFFSIPIQSTKKSKNKKQNEAIQIKAILYSYFYIHSISFAILSTSTKFTNTETSYPQFLSQCLILVGAKVL